MKKKDLIDNLYVDKKLAEEINFNPYYQLIQSGLGRSIKINNKTFVSLGTNDYLGIANNSTIKREAIKVLEEFGISMCGTPIVIGQTSINRKLEQETASFLKQDDALAFPSCYQCNMGVFKLLANEQDVIIADREIHSSLLNGIALTKASFRMFQHNRVDKLKQLLEKYQDHRIKFIVVEGLYSTNGDVPPLGKITEVAKHYDAFVIVDDAHGIGVLGNEGRGVLEVFDVFKDVDLITGSFGKAIGTFGGFLAGNKQLIDGFRYRTPMYLYSTALPPSIAAATIASLEYTKKHSELREKINKYAKKLFGALKLMKFRLTNSTTPLVSITFKTAEDTFLATKMLFEKGIYVVPFVPPSVPKKASRIRLTLNANLREEDVDYVIQVFEHIRKVKPEWLEQDTI